jgi:hypothetical protein
MTLCAFAAFTPAMENPKTIADAVNHETNELRISVPIGAPGEGAVSAYRERDRSAKPIYPAFSSFLLPGGSQRGLFVSVDHALAACLMRSRGTGADSRSGVPRGAARKYCTGHGAICSSSCAACIGQ